MNDFPNWYTIDDDGISSLIYFLKQEFDGKTVKISVEEEHEEKTK